MKAIVSVIGKDTKGIIAKVSGCLFDMNINIEDISQTILQGHFTMIMVVSLDETTLKYEEINKKLSELASSINVEIRIQLEEIFNSMHKI